MTPRLPAIALLALISSCSVGPAEQSPIVVRISALTTDREAAGAVHAALLVQRTAYDNASVFFWAAESAAYRALSMSSPTAGSPVPGRPIVAPCPAGGSKVFRWRPVPPSSATGRELLWALVVEHNGCQVTEGEDGQMLVQEDGPITVTVRRRRPSRAEVVSVRFGADRDGRAPARDYTRSVSTLAPQGTFLNGVARSNYRVSGQFMQHIGPVGPFEGEFSYAIQGFHRAEAHAIPAVLIDTWTANQLSISGSQSSQDDAAFDVRLHFRGGTLTKARQGYPDGDGSMLIRFDGLVITNRKNLISGDENRFTIDGVVSVEYPAPAGPSCVDGTFLIRTTQSLFSQFQAAKSPPSSLRALC